MRIAVLVPAELHSSALQRTVTCRLRPCGPLPNGRCRHCAVVRVCRPKVSNGSEGVARAPRRRLGIPKFTGATDGPSLAPYAVALVAFG